MHFPSYSGWRFSATQLRGGIYWGISPWGPCLLPCKDALMPWGLSGTKAVGCHWSGWLLSLDNPRFLIPALSVLTPLNPFG